MSDVLTFALPAGYRVSSTESDPAVVCERGCGWKMRAATLSRLPADARDQLIRCHEEWHTKRADSRASEWS
jgi:hypothetical protein